MKAIILAGGMGSRLRDVVTDIPKPMAPVGGKPFLEYIIAMLAGRRFRHIILSVGYRKEIIESYFENGSRWGVDISYSGEDAPLGTGGSVREALRTADEPYSLILNGDTFNDLDFGEMEVHHLSRKRLVTIGLIHRDDAGRYGSIRLNHTSDIAGFSEKSGSGPGYVNRGVYIMDRAVLDRMPSGRFSLEEDLFPELVAAGMTGFISRGFFIDMGIPAAYRYIDEHSYLLEQTKPGGAVQGAGKAGEVEAYDEVRS